MSAGLYSGVSGLAIGTGLYKGVSGLWSGASGLVAGWNGATLVLNFLAGAPLDSRITFTRGSNATLVDSTGKITYAPANLLTYSEQFDNAAWVKTAVSATANSTTAPDGTNTADTLAADGTASPHNIRQTGVVAGFARIFFTYAKAGTSNFVQLYFDGDAGPFADFDLATGIVGTTGSNQTASITSVGNGWYRCAIYTASTTATTPRIGIISSASAARAESNSLSTSIYLWGAQLEPVTYQTTPSAYQATTSSAYYGPRFDYDPVTLAAKGLLIEEQRTNLLTYSEQFDNAYWTTTGATVTANSVTSPDGTTNADTLVEDTSTGVHRVYATPACSANTTYTYTAYIKAAGRTQVRLLETTLGGAIFDLSTATVVSMDAGVTSAIQNAGNGWYRCRISATTGAAQTMFVTQIQGAVAGSPTYTGNGAAALYAYGAQLEAGAFATSYIPTVASTVTRSADVATMTGGNFSGWFGGAIGSFVAGWDSYASASPPAIRAAFSFGGTSGFIYVNTGATITVFDGTNYVGASGSAAAAGPHKVAWGFGSSTTSVCLNGATVGTGAYNNSFGAATSIGIGNISGNSSFINGHIRTLAYYNTRLPNAQLQSLTA